MNKSSQERIANVVAALEKLGGDSMPGDEIEGTILVRIHSDGTWNTLGSSSTPESDMSGHEARAKRSGINTLRLTFKGMVPDPSDV